MRANYTIMTSRKSGYTLIEALVASAILLIGISAASSLSLTMVSQEEMNYRISRSLNVLENCARLYQLGVEPAGIYGGTNSLLPPDSAISSIAAVEATVGNLDSCTFTMTIDSVVATGSWSAGMWTAGSQAMPDQRQAVVRAFRPTIR